MRDAKEFYAYCKENLAAGRTASETRPRSNVSSSSFTRSALALLIGTFTPPLISHTLQSERYISQAPQEAPESESVPAAMTLRLLQGQPSKR